MNKKNLILNSCILFSIATCATMTLHELGHFLTAIFCNTKEITLHHNFASYNSDGLSNSVQILIAAAGPLVSLILGIVFHFLCSRYAKRDLLFLFLIYMSALGYIAFGGYLMIAPIFEKGDTGFIFKALNFPFWITIIVAVAGVAFMLNTMKKLSRYFVELATQEIINDKYRRTAFFNNLIKYPLFFGILITTLLNLPAASFVSLAYPLFSPLNLLWSYGYCKDADYWAPKANTELNHLSKISPYLILAFIATIIYNRLLVYGLHW